MKQLTISLIASLIVLGVSASNNSINPLEEKGKLHKLQPVESYLSAIDNLEDPSIVTMEGYDLQDQFTFTENEGVNWIIKPNHSEKKLGRIAINKYGNEFNFQYLGVLESRFVFK